ncbi:hypothetical protein D7319_29240 [Streptomyces radicis]|uniref:HTH-type transcriptional regulator MT1864/Rv1816-like C-terminal domain-containing protein n=1 Tax=Streptomyces radicis TaxID=1750517 RepID=A0A3A9VUG7_9ACTN|nr:hypothetical protein D7319_29240 [Streptomyces radicis]RKN14519.1 hypothetical protein D7318_29180 [Streptomyces radicis]
MVRRRCSTRPGTNAPSRCARSLAGSGSEEDLTGLGTASLSIVSEALGDCVAAGQATSTDLSRDAIALWLGLHGFAHQRAISVAFPWPEDTAERIITALAHLNDGTA